MFSAKLRRGWLSWSPGHKLSPKGIQADPHYEKVVLREITVILLTREVAWSSIPPPNTAATVHPWIKTLSLSTSQSTQHRALLGPPTQDSPVLCPAARAPVGLQSSLPSCPFRAPTAFWGIPSLYMVSLIAPFLIWPMITILTPAPAVRLPGGPSGD